MPPPPHLTPAQLALQAERKALKQARKAVLAGSNGSPQDQSSSEIERRKILRREWLSLPTNSEADRRVKIVTWNMLAQTLVRRELFPGSDCLKWGDRKPMLQAEMESHLEADIICLQECDRLKDVLASVPHHTPIEARGTGKLHGLVVLYLSSRFFPRATRAISLDDEELNPAADSAIARRGGSRQTRNMALVVALQNLEAGNQGIVVVTTHLFWHPKFEYERTRQIIVLLRAVRRLQQEQSCLSWPVVLAGDLNTQPAETTYQMLAGPSTPLDPALIASFNESRLVHSSVTKVGNQVGQPDASSFESDLSASGLNTPAESKELEDEDELPDTDERSIAGTRLPKAEDGIVTLSELVTMAQEIIPEGAKSAYDLSLLHSETFASRGGFKPGVIGAGGNEPAYTCFTPLFKLTLDYLFVLPRSGNEPAIEISSLLAPPMTEELGDGLPRKGISASDHIAVGCEIAW